MLALALVVGVGLTIPIGGQQKKAPPRIELRLTRDVVNEDTRTNIANLIGRLEELPDIRTLTGLLASHR